jgi:peptide/nickel transport system substrate-binding protein
VEMSHTKIVTYAMIGAAVASGWGTAARAAETPVHGGILTFVVASTAPSYDAHSEDTFGVVHPLAPFYSLLIRANPNNLQDPTDFICDLCEGKWEEAKDHMSYTFKIRENVTFHDGTPLTAADIKATIDKIAFPPEGIPSLRKSWYSQIASVETPEKYKLVVKMKRPLPAIIPALASPFNFVYSKKDLDTHGYKWHQRNINGTGAFIFVQEQPGAFIEGKKNPNYFIKGQPYLDGFKAIQAPKMSVRLQAIRGNRAAVEFRGFPPKARDDLVNALGDKVKVQESNWNVLFGVSPNRRKRNSRTSACGRRWHTRSTGTARRKTYRRSPSRNMSAASSSRAIRSKPRRTGWRECRATARTSRHPAPKPRSFSRKPAMPT